MLLNFRVGGFRSFKEISTLKLTASKQRTHNDILFKHQGLRILPAAIVYGANASGKSNLITAISTFRNIVLAQDIESAKQQPRLELCAFAHADDCPPMYFEIDFIKRNTRFRYSLELETKFLSSKVEIISEKLDIVLKTRTSTVFERKTDEVYISREERIHSDITSANHFIDPNGFSILEILAKQNLSPTKLFLTGAFAGMVSNTMAETVVSFFEDDLRMIGEISDSKEIILSELVEDVNESELLSNERLDALLKEADFGPQQIAIGRIPENSQGDESNPVGMFSIFDRKGKEAIIPSELIESLGTRKIVEFYLLLSEALAKGSVIILDEFDSSLHSEIVRGFIRVFHDPELNSNGAQLIFVTHNPIYLDNVLMRRDQIFFVEKDEETYNSSIYSLADLGSEELRNDHNYLLSYLKGRYSALPFLDFASLLLEEQ